MLSQSKKTQFPTLSSNSQQKNFKLNYQQLQAGINRLRYIKKKQQKHQISMTHNLNNLLSKIENHQSACSTPPIKKQIPKFNKYQFFKYDLRHDSPYHSSSFKNINKCQENNNSQSDPKESHNHFFKNKEQTKENHPFDHKQMHYLMKKQNFEEMKALRLKRQEKIRALFKEKITQARQRKTQILLSQQQGRKKISQNYYTHIQSIKTQKRLQEEKKKKLNQQKCHRLMEIHKQQQQQLAQYEKSIILEQSLKDMVLNASNSNLGKQLMITQSTFT